MKILLYTFLIISITTLYAKRHQEPNLQDCEKLKNNQKAYLKCVNENGKKVNAYAEKLREEQTRQIIESKKRKYKAITDQKTKEIIHKQKQKTLNTLLSPFGHYLQKQADKIKK